MSATESTESTGSTGSTKSAGVSMRDLLASCAAAEAVSTPPRLPDLALVEEPAEQQPKAA
ncbi:hypothetical protein SAMN04487983_101898 [Streptomyces sp. yr375]|uniref:hypothetical protein n=1 Tax=Streptomyces sp. yr375 TaxID=1761906 RepID=UPI0008D09D8A|nr:hypothetical protein [Streptomyces sp. yr375]SER57136.1 hypothetical protein SAMN04487983_101898 [Streptomyces sp. yr375]